MHRPFALPGVRPRYAPDRAFQVRHLRLELALDWEKKAVAGRATLALRRLHAARQIELDAVEMDIARVSLGEFSYDGQKLRINVPAGDEFELTIEYSCQPRRGLYF